MSTGDVGHAEQEDAVRALSQHFTGGRLEVDAFDERVRRARAAGSWAELAVLFGDLPHPHPSFPPGAGPGSGGDGGTTDRSGRTAATPVDAAAPPAGTAAFPTDAAPGPTGARPAGPADHSGPGTAGTARIREPYPGRATPAPDPYPGPAAPHRHPPPPWPPAHDAQQPGFPGYGPGYESGPGLYGGFPAAYPPHPGPPAYGAYAGYDPAAPFGREPYSGRPYSDRQRIVGGLLQLFLPFGIGRFYTGHTGLAVAQLLVTLFTFGFGAIWSFIDGIVILAGSPTDPDGRPLRP